MTDETADTNRPLNLILDCRESVQIAATRFQRVRHGLSNFGHDRAVKQWHVAVLAYRREIAKYSNNRNIKEEWREEIDAVEKSLHEIGQMELAVEPKTEWQFNPNTQTEEPKRVEKPHHFEPNELIAIMRQLDKCVSALGFDAPAETQPEIFGVDPDFDG